MNRKIGILTFHDANNYGAVLQAYALQKYLEGLYPDNKVEVIDYKCEGVKRQRTLRYYIHSQQIIFGVIHFLAAILRIRKIDKFCKLYIKCSEQIRNRDELTNQVNNYDFMVSGSDQVWNRKWTGGEDTYLQDFHRLKCKKLSYAASFGVAELPEEWKKDYAILLKDFSGVSVREEAGKQICKNIDIESEIHVDPTLLLGQKEWDRIAEKGERINKPYVLVYMVPYQEEVYKRAKEIAEKNNLDLFNVCKSLKHLGKQYKGISPVENIVSMFKNAEYVVTNSFHGTAFSIIYHRKAVVVLNNKWGYNIRSAQLLSTLGIADVSGKQDYVDCFEIDWKAVEEKMSKERNRTKKYFVEKII